MSETHIIKSREDFENTWIYIHDYANCAHVGDELKEDEDHISLSNYIDKSRNESYELGIIVGYEQVAFELRNDAGGLFASGHDEKAKQLRDMADHFDKKAKKARDVLDSKRMSGPRK